jgi:hypothetical protein
MLTQDVVHRMERWILVARNWGKSSVTAASLDALESAM